MRLELSTDLDAPADRVWTELNKTGLLLHIAKPLIHFRPVDPPTLPERWNEGRYLVSMWLFGLLPLGRQTIGISFPQDSGNPARRNLRDQGSSALIRVWDHRISIEAIDRTRTRYTDRVEIGAGVMTPLVWLFARLFFAHRQARWRALVARGFTLPT